MTREQYIAQATATQRALRRFLVALCCGDAQLADDLAQEALMRAYLAADTLADPDKFRPWVYRIAYRAFLNQRRAERPTADIDEAASVATAEGADSAFRYQALYAALDRLPASERTALLLFYMEDYSVKEIASVVDASADAVKQHLSRGRNHLRMLLEPNA